MRLRLIATFWLIVGAILIMLASPISATSRRAVVLEIDGAIGRRLPTMWCVNSGR
jgi:hypothetical protein